MLLGIVAFLFNILLACFPLFSEKFYRNNIYQSIRWIWDYSIGKIPFLGFFLFLFIILFFIKKNYSKSKITLILNFVGYLIFFFYFLWGFNYSAIKVSDKIKLNVEKVERTTLIELTDKSIELAAISRKNLSASIILDTHLEENLENSIRPLVAKTLRDFGYPTTGNVRCKEISTSGWMRSLGISGIYFPFTLESYVDGSQTTISKTYTIAHEMAHGYGVTDEGEANFIAYVALTDSDNQLLQYIGYYQLMNYQLIRLRDLDYDRYKTFEENLPYWIKQDLENQRENARSHQTKFPWLSDKMNDLYLKSQGLKEGTDSYDSVVELVSAYENPFVEK